MTGCRAGFAWPRECPQGGRAVVAGTRLAGSAVKFRWTIPHHGNALFRSSGLVFAAGMISVAKVQRRNAWRYYVRGVAFGIGRRPVGQALKDAQDAYAGTGAGSGRSAASGDCS